MSIRIGSLHIIVLAIAVLAGCGRSGPERVVLSGTVTYDGKPIEEGQIRFLPVKGTKGPMCGTPIVEGKYTADHKGGIPFGNHTIQIDGYHNTGLKAAKGELNGGGLIGEQYVPWKHNRYSELTITVEPGSGTLTKNFDLIK